MTKTIGIRVTPSIIYFSIIREEDEGLEIIVIDKINSPKALIIPEQLKFIRNTLKDIIAEFEIDKACIRTTESIAQSINITRIYIEGIIQELFASSTIKKYYVGQISNISANIGIDREEFIPYRNGEKNFLEIEHWKDYNKEERESIMAAISAINI